MIKMLAFLHYSPAELNLSYLIVTLHLAVFLPSTVVTVIYAIPFLIPLTIPVVPTLAILMLDDFHVTFLFAAVAGKTVAMSFEVFPFKIVNTFLFSLTLDT